MQIHELPAQTTAANADVLAVDNGTSTQKITAQNFKNYAIGSTDISAIGSTVTAAISALKSEFNSLFIRKSYSYEYTIAANAQLGITGEMFGLSVPTGYFPIAIRRFTTGHSYVVPVQIMHNSGTNVALWIRNTSNSSVTNTAIVEFLYSKSSYVTQG